MNLSDLGERIWALLSRGRVTGADGNKPMRTLQLELLSSDARDNVEHMEPYGFTSEPFVESEALAASLSGDRNHTVVITVADRRYRLKALKQGEVAIFDDQHRKVHLTRDGIVIDGVNSPITIKTGGTVDVKGQTINLTASNIKLKASNIALDSPMVNSSGAMKSVGDVSGAGISLSRHTHRGDSGGTTSTPN